MASHSRIRAIKEGQFRFENQDSHFIGIQLFQINFPLNALESFKIIMAKNNCTMSAKIIDDK